jgi:hypothetical protein
MFPAAAACGSLLSDACRSGPHADERSAVFKSLVGLRRIAVVPASARAEGEG